MNQLSPGQKWLTIIVMALVVAGAVYGTLVYSPDLQELGQTYGPSGHAPQMYLWGAEIVVCLAIWGAAYLICAAIQRSMDVWQGFNLLPVLLLAVIAVNFGPQFARLAGFQWSPVSNFQSLRALEDDNVSTILMNNNACQAELDQLGYPKFMRPVSLGVPKGLKMAREKIAKTRAAVQSCQARDEAQAAKFRQAAEALQAKGKRDVPESGRDSAEADVARLHQIDFELLAEYERMLDDLAASKGGWYASGFQLTFYRQHDLDKFNAHEAKVKKLSDERARVTEQLWARRAAP